MGSSYKSINDIYEGLRKNKLKNEFLLSAEEKLSRLSVPRPEVPEEQPPKFPADITLLNDNELGYYYGRFMGWKGYISYLVTLKEADELYYRNALNIARKYIANEITSSGNFAGLKKTEIKEMVESSQLVIELEYWRSEAEVEKLAAKGRLEYFDSCAAALSREISRRELKNGKFM